MISFKAFYEAVEIGLIENINLEGLGELPAKSDSGNMAFNVLHGLDVNILGNKVKFKTVGNNILEKELLKTKEAPEGIIDINIGSGNIEKRPVVGFNVTIKRDGSEVKFNNVPFSIADRQDNETPILLGMDFLIKINAKIDVTKNNLISDE